MAAIAFHCQAGRGVMLAGRAPPTPARQWVFRPGVVHHQHGLRTAIAGHGVDRMHHRIFHVHRIQRAHLVFQVGGPSGWTVEFARDLAGWTHSGDLRLGRLARALAGRACGVTGGVALRPHRRGNRLSMAGAEMPSRLAYSATAAFFSASAKAMPLGIEAAADIRAPGVCSRSSTPPSFMADSTSPWPSA